MNATTPPAAKPPVRRDLRSPYFVLRTPDGLGSYFTSENLPIVGSTNEPLARFLAPAQVVEGPAGRAVEYDLPPAVLETARPLDVLPQAEIDRFRAAAAAFYEKARASTPRIVPHEKRLRAHFRLPDPDLEPDAYWVHGPAHDRRLIILWGVERRVGSSLPLAPEGELGLAPGATLLDRLQARAMGWEARQREAARFAFEAGEPIARFLARTATDAKGNPVGLSCQGRAYPAAKLRPMRRISASECAAFERAARAFYDRAAGATAYEREIRQAFRLPDPDACPDAFRVAGGRLLIGVTGKETQTQTLPLVEHPLTRPEAASEPAPEPAASDASPTAPIAVVAAEDASSRATVAARLRERSISAKVVVTLQAAAAVAVAAAACFAWRWVTDRTPPHVVESADFPAALDNRTVEVAFSKPIGAKSLQLGAGDQASFVFGDNDARILAERIDPRDSRKVLLTTTPLGDGQTYELTVNRVADRSGHPLAEPTSVRFRYLDTVAPRIVLVSAGENANQLELVFSKPVLEASLAGGGNYSIFGLEGSGEGAPQRIASAHLDPEDKTGCTAVLEAVRDFVRNAPYRLESLGSVTDASVSRNLAFLPAKGLDFAYRDSLPPRLRSISASARSLELTVVFSKPVDAAAAENTANYDAAGPDQTKLSFVPGAVSLDPTGQAATLRIAPTPLKLGIYRLTVRSMRDRAGNPTPAPLVVSFEFADDDGQPLNILSHSLVAADNQFDNRVTLTFNHPVNPEAATRAGCYALRDEHGLPLGVKVVEARRVPEDPAKILLILSAPPTPGVRIDVQVTGVSDLFGRAPSAPIDYAFVPPGIPGRLSEQVLTWIRPPVLQGDNLTLSIRQAVARASALAPANYTFNRPNARVRGIEDYEVRTDPSGDQSTKVVLQVDVPASVRSGLTLRAKALTAQGLEFLGPQQLKPIEVAVR